MGMHLRRKALVAAGVTAAVAGGGAVAYAATNDPSTGHDPRPAARHGHGPGHARAQLPAGARTVIQQIRTAVLDQGSGIVDPIIDQAVSAGKLSADQAATARQALADLKAGRRPSADALALLRDEQVRAVAAQAFQALAKQLPAIADPIVDDARSQGTIDQATADAMRQRIQAMADRAAQGGLPFGHRARPFGHRGGPGGPGHGPRGHGMPRPAAAGVLGDIAKAVAQKAPGVAGPIIDKAAAAGTITGAQADELRAAASDLASGGRGALMAHRDLLADAGVRAVVHDVVKALAAQAPSVAKPIIDKAVSDGTITQAQADRLTQRIAAAAKRVGG